MNKTNEELEEQRTWNTKEWRVEFSEDQQLIHYAFINEPFARGKDWEVIYKGFTLKQCDDFANIMNPKLFNRKIKPLKTSSVKNELKCYLEICNDISL